VSRTIAPDLADVVEYGMERVNMIEAPRVRKEWAAVKMCVRELRDIKRARGHEDNCLCSMCRALARLDRLGAAEGAR